MEKIKIKIIDESGDRKYFTQLPSIILNHSTAVDQALYWQMKRYAGESGKCFATQETLMKKLGVGRWAYNKSLKYLLSKGWIKFDGTTQGKTRPIKTYSIVDIWKLNIMEYEKIPSNLAVSFEQEIPSSLAGDTVQISSKIPPRLAIEEDLPRRIVIKNIFSDANASQNKEIAEIIKLFETVNPLIGKYYGNKTQRASVVNLLAALGREKLESVIVILPKTNAMQYAPKITTPYQLEENYAKLEGFVREKSIIKNNVAKIR